MNVLHRMLKRREVASDALLAAIGIWLCGDVRRDLSFKIRVGPGENLRHLAAVESFDSPPHDLYVLLRHRLLRQTEGGEGALAVPPLDKPDHPAVVQAKQDRG